MRRLSSPLLPALLLFLLGACVSVPLDGDDSPGATGSTSRGVTSAQFSEGEVLLNRALDALGGADAVGAVQTMLVEGATRSVSAEGKELEAEIRTFVEFPSFYRQEVALPFGSMTTLIGPGRGWIIVDGEEPLPLPEERRFEIEAILLRNPIALLKTRRSDLFQAYSVPAEDPTCGGSAQCLGIDVGIRRTTLRLNEDGLISEVVYSIPGSSDDGSAVTMHYSDYRTVGDRLLYPFRSVTSIDGGATHTTQISRILLNEPIPQALFEPVQ